MDFILVDVVNDYSFTFNGSILSYFLLADTREDGYQNNVIAKLLTYSTFMDLLPFNSLLEIYGAKNIKRDQCQA